MAPTKELYLDLVCKSLAWFSEKHAAKYPNNADLNSGKLLETLSEPAS